MGADLTLPASFERLLRLYPNGLPKRLIKRRQSGGVVFVYGSELSGEESLLLKAAVEKGLGAPFDSVKHCLAKTLDSKTLGLSLVVILGESAHSQAAKELGEQSLIPGEIVKTPSGIEAMLTVELSAVLKSPDVKREFWRHLKVIMPRVGGRSA